MLLTAAVSLILVLVLYPILRLVGVNVQFSKVFEVVYTGLLFAPVVVYMLFIVSAITLVVSMLIYSGLLFALTPFGLNERFRDVIVSSSHLAPAWVWFFGAGAITYGSFGAYSYRKELKASRYRMHLSYLLIAVALMVALSVGGIFGALLATQLGR